MEMKEKEELYTECSSMISQGLSLPAQLNQYRRTLLLSLTTHLQTPVWFV